MLKLLLALLMLQMPAGMTHDEHLKTRGAAAMGFDQNAAVHHFRLARDGGSIDVEVKDASDAPTRTAIRAHLKEVAVQFANGDFSKPLLTHAEKPPGSARMAALRSTIEYKYEESERGGRVRIRSANAEAIGAVHEFLRYQIREHHTGDPTALHLPSPTSPDRIGAVSDERVALIRTPDNGLQPRAMVDQAGVVHLTYFGGNPMHGDVFYTRLMDGRFAPAVRVNAQPGSAIATGNVRGPSLALGRDERVHVAWMGSDRATRVGDAAPMLYTRSNANHAFEPERNLHQNAGPIDGGSVGADRDGHVYVAWHSELPGSKGEDTRRAWIARSRDDGGTFAHETSASPAGIGACGCCGTGTFVAANGTMYMLFRSARETVHRETVLLASTDHGATFTSRPLQDWEIAACPMSTFSLGEGDGAVVAAWETAGQVYWARVDGAASASTTPIAAPGGTGGRKHPAVARNARGETLLAWTEGMGWSRGGSLAWQIFDGTGEPIGETGRAEGVPPWSLVAAYAKPDGTFGIIY